MEISPQNITYTPGGKMVVTFDAEVTLPGGKRMQVVSGGTVPLDPCPCTRMVLDAVAKAVASGQPYVFPDKGEREQALEKQLADMAEEVAKLRPEKPAEGKDGE